MVCPRRSTRRARRVPPSRMHRETMRSMSDEWPLFARDVPDAAWRPTASDLAESRLACFLRASGEPDLTALQRRAADDPAWFWGAASDDIGIRWQRTPR